MPFQDFLDAISIGGIFLLFAVVSLLAYEGGFRIGRWWQERTPEETEGPTGVLVGSLLALMAFLLAISMGMADDRFDTRRALVLAEANSIGTTYLRAGYLPEPAASRSREAFLREYVPLRIVPNDKTEVATRIVRSTEIQAELWSIAEDLARSGENSDLMALYIESLNETIDIHEERVIAGLYARVPVTVLALLIVGAALTLGMVGYSAGLTQRRSLLTAVVLIVVLGAVITLVIDLDRPRDGLLIVSEQPLVDLQAQLSPTP